MRANNWRKSYLAFKSWIYKAFCVFSLFFIFLSCQTFFKTKSFIPADLSLYKTGAFSGALKLYHKNQKSHFNGDVFISEAGLLRMDLSVFPGSPAFSLFSDAKELILLFLKRKEFYKGSFAKSPLFFSKNLELSLFKEIFFDRPPLGKKWLCQKDSKKLPLKCQNKTGVIEWRRGKNRLLSFRDLDFEFVFHYFSFSPQVEKETFVIKVPRHFQPFKGSK